MMYMLYICLYIFNRQTQMSSDEPAKREALKPKEYVKRCDVIVFCFYHLLFV